MKPGAKPKGLVSLNWSPEFAYAVGLLTADGCLSSDGRHIDLTSKDRIQISTFKKCLKLKTPISTKTSGRGDIYYCVQFSDVLFYTFLQSIGLTPAKSKTLSLVRVPREYFRDFLRGYFDGDGCSYSFYDSVFPKSYRFYISFISASPNFLIWLRDQIEVEVAIRGHMHLHSNPAYRQLKYAKRESIEFCRYLYYEPNIPCLRRKYLKIQRSLRIISRRRGGEIGIHASFRS